VKFVELLLLVAEPRCREFEFAEPLRGGEVTVVGSTSQTLYGW